MNSITNIPALDLTDLRATYPGRVILPGDADYDQARKIKQRYDPDNLFHVNQNIPPAAKEGK